MKPVLLLDCDNVLLEFARPFQHWLHAHHAIEFRIDSFALLDNMRHMDDGRPVSRSEFPALLDGFFAKGQTLQQPLPGAVEAVRRLADLFDVTVLTNIPEEWREIRARHLDDLGFAVPVVANDGAKGPKVLQLAAGRPAVFVDDLPPNLDSAAEHAPHVGRLHMVGEESLQSFIPAARQAHARIDSWAEAEPWIHQWFEKER